MLRRGCPQSRAGSSAEDQRRCRAKVEAGGSQGPRLDTPSRHALLKRMGHSQTHYTEFVNLLESYDVIPADQRKLFAGPPPTNQNPMIRREAKIAQFKLEKELKSQLQELRRRRQSRPNRVTAVATDALTGASSMSIPEASTSRSRGGVDDSDDDEDSDARPFYIAWLKALYLQAHQELASISAEIEMLSYGMQMSDLPSGGPARITGDERAPTSPAEEEDSSWRLDRVATGSGLRDAAGPLVSPSGKVLRPFTILPSNSRSATRLRLQSEVFRPDWALPTMTIDEYLDQQEAQGNFLSGGGPEQQAQETDGERKKREAEDDTIMGEERHEELRREKAKWDEFTDTHRKGEGNMMNRG